MLLKLPKEQREILIKRLQDFFYEERSEEIGDLPAEILLDFIIKELGPVIYNQAIADAIKLVGEKMVSLEDDLHALKKNSTYPRR